MIRILPLTYSHFWDEAVFLQDAKVILDGRDNYDEFFERPPLLSIMYALAFSVWNDVYVANFLQGLFSALAVLFAFLYTRKTFGLVPGVCAAFVLAFGPYFVGISHQLMTDMPAVTLMLAAMWLFDLPGVRSALLAGVVWALAVEMRFTALFLFLYFLLEVGFSIGKLRRLLLLGAGTAVTLAPYLIWLKSKYGSFLQPFVHADRIVREWTAPIPASFYFDGIRGIFPLTLWIALMIGVAVLARHWFMASRRIHDAEDSSGTPDSFHDVKRQTLLLIWGAAFLAYMLSIPHKEVRYLLPLAIPAVVVGGSGIAYALKWLQRQALPLQVAGVIFGGVLAAADYGPSMLRLAGPFTDHSQSPEVQIGRYLRERSSASDTIYAAHNFPVLAFYSERHTVSLLPIQESFDAEWRRFMSQPGYFVYFQPEQVGEIHAPNPDLQPDREFIAAHHEFEEVRSLPTAIIYRYTPVGAPGSPSSVGFP